ncbi:MAG: serpin family protein [Candidatus Eisenbacteria bacterium]
MLRPFLVPCVLLVALSCLLSCGSSAPKPTDPFSERRLPDDLQAGASRVVEGNNAFACDLYAQLRSEPGNLFFSPFSISTALAMCRAGARASTEAQIADVFHFDLTQEQFHPVFGALQASLDRGASIGGYELRVANRLWGQSGYPFEPEFLRITREDYGAEIASIDFIANPETARQEINEWVEERTNRRIEDLFPEGSIIEWTRLVLANAIYFRGTWQTAFDPAETRPRSFHLLDGTTVDVPMMSMKTDAAVGNFDGVEVLELPYDGKDVSMLFLLPPFDETLADLEARLTPENLRQWAGGLAMVERFSISIPKFRFSWGEALNDPLIEMGMPDAFNPNLADFSGIAENRGLFIAWVFHKAFVEVNEAGTEAAAATGVVFNETAIQGFSANRPFLFLIRDNVTGSILFLGRVVDPRS